MLREVTCLTVSRDGRRVATAEQGGIIRLWDTTRLRELAVLDGARSSAEVVAFSPDGTLLAVVKIDCFELWNIAGDRTRPPVTLKMLWSSTSVAFASDNSLLALGGRDGAIGREPEDIVKLWDLDHGPAKEQPAVKGYLARAPLSRFDGKPMLPDKLNGTVGVWDEGGKEIEIGKTLLFNNLLRVPYVNAYQWESQGGTPEGLARLGPTSVYAVASLPRTSGWQPPEPGVGLATRKTQPWERAHVEEQGRFIQAFAFSRTDGRQPRAIGMVRWSFGNWMAATRARALLQGGRGGSTPLPTPRMADVGLGQRRQDRGGLGRVARTPATGNPGESAGPNTRSRQRSVGGRVRARRENPGLSATRNAIDMWDVTEDTPSGRPDQYGWPVSRGQGFHCLLPGWQDHCRREWLRRLAPPLGPYRGKAQARPSTSVSN